MVPPGAGRPPDGPGHPDRPGAAPPERPDDGRPPGYAGGDGDGRAVELLLFAYGRQGAAKVELEGEENAIAKLRETKQLGI